MTALILDEEAHKVLERVRNDHGGEGGGRPVKIPSRTKFIILFSPKKDASLVSTNKCDVIDEISLMKSLNQAHESIYLVLTGFSIECLKTKVNLHEAGAKHGLTRAREPRLVLRWLLFSFDLIKNDSKF